jgi:signal transduction histidine kinase
MSHEIRTPLNAIMGFQRTCYATPTCRRKSAKRTPVTVRRNGALLTQIIDLHPDLSKVEANKLTIERALTPLPRA